MVPLGLETAREGATKPCSPGCASAWLSESLLYNWRSSRKAAALAVDASEPVTFVPVGVLSRTAPQAAPSLAPPAPEAAAQAAPGEARAGSIEIALANGARRSVDAFVNEKALARVLRAMKGAACYYPD